MRPVDPRRLRLQRQGHDGIDHFAPGGIAARDGGRERQHRIAFRQQHEVLGPGVEAGPILGEARGAAEQGIAFAPHDGAEHLAVLLEGPGLEGDVAPRRFRDERVLALGRRGVADHAPLQVGEGPDPRVAVHQQGIAIEEHRAGEAGAERDRRRGRGRRSHQDVDLAGAETPEAEVLGGHRHDGGLVGGAQHGGGEGTAHVGVELRQRGVDVGLAPVVGLVDDAAGERAGSLDAVEHRPGLRRRASERDAERHRGGRQAESPVHCDGSCWSGFTGSGSLWRSPIGTGPDPGLARRRWRSRGTEPGRGPAP